jgi:hypothetical protein
MTKQLMLPALALVLFACGGGSPTNPSATPTPQ